MSARLRKRKKSYWKVLRILRRMMAHGGIPPFNERGNRQPGTFLGCIGRVKEIMAHRRKRRGRAPLPASLRRWQR